MRFREQHLHNRKTRGFVSEWQFPYLVPFLFLFICFFSFSLGFVFCIARLPLLRERKREKERRSIVIAVESFWLGIFRNDWASWCNGMLCLQFSGSQAPNCLQMHQSCYGGGRIGKGRKISALREMSQEEDFSV